MSALPQFRAREIEAESPADPVRIAAPAPGLDNPLQFLRDAIAQLKSSNGYLGDQAEVADLLAEAREALERANVAAQAMAQCEGFAREAQFNDAFAALDAALRAYPDDPALLTRRREVEEQQKGFHAAAAVRTAIEEAEWLFAQGRVDLAVHFLMDKVAELPDQPALISSLEGIEAMLPRWEQKRHVQSAMGRAETLVKLQQWQAALTILEEALQSYPASEELIGATKHVRDQLVEHERQKKLARRLDLIEQKIAAHSWRQALTLLENAQKEFPLAPELDPLQREVDAGLRNSECEAIVTEVRQCLADGELDQAERVLRKGLESLGPEPVIEALREELESDRTYREELRKAQILFGRRQLPEAERILTQFADPNRPEAQALLHAVREARAATEEEDFYERGRLKALELMQTQQFAQAADLLGNLLALFPGNPILERDLMTAQTGLEQASAFSSRAPKVVPATEEENREPPPPTPTSSLHALQPDVQTEVQTVPVDGRPVREGGRSRFGRAAIGGMVLLLSFASGIVWNLSRNSPPVSRPAAASAAQFPADMPPSIQSQAIARVPASPPGPPQNSSPQPQATQLLATRSTAPSTPPGKATTQPAQSRTTSLRQFVPPDAKQAPVQNQSSVLPLPPGTEPIISAETIPVLPAGFAKSVSAPAPPAAAPPPPVASAPTPAAKPTLPAGGRFQAAQLINRTLPEYPALARLRGVFGPVRMDAVIDEQGTVMNVKAVSGDPILAAAAKSAVLRWKYKPATLNDRPIASNVEIQIVFGDRKK